MTHKHRFVSRSFLTLLATLLVPTLSAHQGGHPTGLERCEDALLALDGFKLFGAAVTGSQNQPILEPQHYRLINTAKPTEIPHSEAKISFVLGSGHQGGYGDYNVRVVLPSRTYEFNAATNAIGNTWVINPLIEGWSGTMMVSITSTICDLTMKATASWNLPKPNWITNPCGSCQNLTCRSTASIGSVELSIPVGVVHYGLEPISLLYESESLANGGAALLSVDGPTNPDSNLGAVITKNGGTITSIECGEHLTRITPAPLPTDPNRFAVTVSSDKKDPDGTIYREAIIEDVVLPGPENAPALRMTETVGGTTNVRHYTQPDPNTWILTEQDQRRTTKTILSETVTTRITRWQTEERNAAGIWAEIALRDETETNYDWGWTLTSLVRDPDGEALTSSWDYYDESEFSGPNADTSGRGRLQEETLPTGLVRNFQYLDNDPFNSGFTQVEITREAFAGTPDLIERRRHVAYNGTSLDELHETFIGGVQVGKTEVRAHSSGGSNWREELHYPDTGGPPLAHAL